MPVHVIRKAALLEFCDGKVLFVRSRNSDLFYTPGGKPQPGENDVEALVREVREEIDVKLMPQTVKFITEFTGKAHGMPEGTVLVMNCYMAVGAGVIRPCSEIEEIAWFTSADGGRTTEMGRTILNWLKRKELID